MHLVGRLGWAPLWPQATESLEKVHADFQRKLSQLRIDSVNQLSEAMGLKPSGTINDQPGQQPTGAGAQADAGVGADEPEAARENEVETVFDAQEDEV
jgi:hypothetical protein